MTSLSRTGSARIDRTIVLAGVLLGLLCVPTRGSAQVARPSGRLFARENLVAWCIVPFDSKKRGPEDRAAMLERLGFKRFAYDWRGEHIPTFDAELDALKRHGIKLEAFWVAPGELNKESRIILDVLKRHEVKADLWVLLDLGADRVTGAEQERRVMSASARLKPLAEAANAIGCRVALYNHGGWFGEPENQLAIIDRLAKQGVGNVGVVYNLHHGHDHVDRLAEILAKLKPHLWAVNLNGTERNGDKVGKKILPLGQGSLDLDLLKSIRASGYSGPIGILGHTDDDAEKRLRDNLDGLDWLVPQLDGGLPGPKPIPRTYSPPPAASGRADATPYRPELVAQLLAEARTSGDPLKGAQVFGAAQYGCVSCHKVGGQGGTVGPDLTPLAGCTKPEEIVESILWPKRTVKPGFEAFAVETRDGRAIQGYKQDETDKGFAIRDAATGEVRKLAKSEIEAVREVGTLMPEGLLATMTPDQRRDLVRFLIDLGRPGQPDLSGSVHHAPATFAYDRAPLRPELWPNWKHPINRDRVYDFYSKEAEHFRKQPGLPALLPPFPGLDGGGYGHWGNQNDNIWTDSRWNETDLGSLLSGVFRGAGVTVPKGVCVRLGDQGEMAACFNPETLRYEVIWEGGFVEFSAKRHGLMDGLILQGRPLHRSIGAGPDKPFVYRGYYRSGKRVVFAYRVGDVEMLDSPWVEGGKFTRLVGPVKGHPLADRTRGGSPQWPQVIETRGSLGTSRPYAVDTIEPPFKNPWKALLFFGDHDFLPDGTALICTVQGDVWRVQGLDGTLEHVRWRRFASGLHQALGLVVSEGKIYVLGRDQLTRLNDIDGDGEADFYECVSNAYETSPAGHDFICGLQRDNLGNFLTVSGKQGLIRIRPDGKTVEVVATGFRNADGVAMTPGGVVTVPSSEGEWSPASMISEVRPGGYYGYGGPKGGKAPDLPLVYLPRGLDNSSGSQVYVSSDRWGALLGRIVHFSYGTGTHFLLLREQVEGQPQGAVVPLPGDFNSGVHRGRFNPKDGQLYVSGMGGWGTYTPADGSFQRVRYTGDPVQLPVAFHARENGVLIEFSRPIDRSLAEAPGAQFAQAWNYRYGAGYGSQELSPSHPGMPGHDALAVRSATVLPDGKTLFLEIPDLQPVSQLHLHLRVDDGRPLDLFGTVHRLAAPFTDYADYRPGRKTIATHPILVDMALASKATPNPWRKSIPKARPITIEAGKNLSFAQRSITVRAGEPIKLTFLNPDVVPHNWALIKPGTLATVGDLANKIIADPEAVARHYIPRTDDVLVHTDMVYPQDQFSISFLAPAKPGRYPYLCTFPGHWMVMNGVMVVE